MRGSGQNDDRTGFAEQLGSRALRIVNAVRTRAGVGHSTVASAGLTYPASRVDTADGLLAYPGSVEAGQMALEASLTQWSKECPAADFILFGYSQGADVVASGWARLPADVRAKVVSATLFGDPRYNPDDPADADTAARDGGPLGARDFLEAGTFRSWCATSDVVCQGSPANVSHLSSRVHGSTYDRWEQVEVDTIVAALFPSRYTTASTARPCA